MDKITKQTLNKKLTVPFVVALAGILVVVIALFLPYMTAVGEMAEYIEKFPDRIEIESLDLTAGDMANISVISVSKLITGIYGEDDGVIANAIVFVFGGFLVLTALFTILKKPIAIMIFDLLSFGTFAFLNFLMKEDFIGADKYAWGVGYYIMLMAIVVVFASAVWMLVKKIVEKKKLSEEMLHPQE